MVLGLFPTSGRDDEQAEGGTGDGGVSLIGTPFLVAKISRSSFMQEPELDAIMHQPSDLTTGKNMFLLERRGYDVR